MCNYGFLMSVVLESLLHVTFYFRNTCTRWTAFWCLYVMLVILKSDLLESLLQVTCAIVALFFTRDTLPFFAAYVSFCFVVCNLG